MVVVSHDRHLLKTTTEVLLLVANGEVKEFDGDLDDYRDWLNQSEATLPVPISEDSAAMASAKTVDRKEQKRQEAEIRNARAAQRRPLENAIRAIDKDMEKLNSEKLRLHGLLNSEALYTEAQKEALKLALRQQADVEARIHELEEKWLLHQSELELL